MSLSELIEQVAKAIEELDGYVIDASCEGEEDDQPVLTKQQVRRLAGAERVLHQIGTLYGPD